MKGKWFLALMPVLLLQSCVLLLKDNISGSGRVTTESRAVSGINGMELNAIGEAQVVVGSAEALVVEAEDNLMQYITTEVVNGRLKLDISRNVTISPTRPIRYTIIVKDINDAVINGSGDISISGISENSMNLNINGSGSINASGDCVYLNTDIAGSGSINASDLMANIVNTDISGSGSATVWASDNLNALISGSGNINYYGNPNVTKNITGSGSVHFLGYK